MIFTHTFVPSRLRGKGVAQKLVEVALKHAMAEKLRVDPACSYVAAFIERRPEYKVMVV
jgi:predicted GNAT family acetyltransferase